ncbi:MAG: ABC transporter [Peptococcaceae bacterium BICA1-7]|nr:MAG: ABC transporter [Peptococcaceae bacterium BICA1-7]HBV99555.1 ABC transporter ATP-binding protein [Desulfotomaculum sp.]
MVIKKSEQIVTARGLVKKFGDFTAVKGIDFTVAGGECFGLLGPNGAGKSSVVRMIHGFSPVTGGSLAVFGKDISAGSREIKARIGVVPQDDNLDPELTVWQNLVVYAGYFRMQKDRAESRAEEILAFMDLSEKSGHVVEHLSGGQKRRLTIGRALINQPDLLILDEPTTGLDPHARRIVWQRLRRLKEAGTTMILTTHYLEEASQLCDRLLVLHRGSILEEGAPAELVHRHVGSHALELGLDPGQMGMLAEGLERLIKSRQLLGDEMVLFTDQGRDLAAKISARADEMDIAISRQMLRQSNLEDVFLKLTGETLTGDHEEEPGGDR